MELSEFLIARLSEDKAVARAATEAESGDWHTTVEETGDGENAYYAVADDDHMAEDYAYFADFSPRGPSSGANRATHIARWDPARVLAECESKRRIVELYRDAEQAVATYDHAHPTDAYWQEWGNRHALALAVEFLALPYADHPDFDESWRP